MTASKPKLPAMSTSHYEPKVGDTITIDMPGERTRATIERVISDEAVIARLQHFTTSREHGYRKDDLVPCRFTTLDMGVPGWRAISETELGSAESAQKKKKRGA